MQTQEAPCIRQPVNARALADPAALSERSGCRGMTPVTAPARVNTADKGRSVDPALRGSMAIMSAQIGSIQGRTFRYRGKGVDDVDQGVGIFQSHFAALRSERKEELLHLLQRAELLQTRSGRADLSAKPEADATGADHSKVDSQHPQPQRPAANEKGNPALYRRVDGSGDENRDCALSRQDFFTHQP